MPSLLYSPRVTEPKLRFMDIAEAGSQLHHLLSPRRPSCLRSPFSFLSPYPRHQTSLRNVFKFTLCMGHPISLTQFHMMTAKKGLSIPTFQGLCKIVWIMEADVEEGQYLYITGDPVALGCWEPEIAILMSPTGQTNIWRAEVKIASGVNLKYNYFLRGETWSSSDIIWRPGPEFSLSVPLVVKHDRTIVVRDSWIIRSKTERSPPHLWGSWVEETCQEVIGHHESFSEESKQCLLDSTPKDVVYSDNELMMSAADEVSDSNMLFSEKYQPVEEPWLVQSSLFFCASVNGMKSELSKKIDTGKDEVIQSEINNHHHYPITENFLPEGGRALTSKEDSIVTIILINSSICAMQRIAVLEDGKLVGLLLEPVKGNVQCDNIYLGVVTKLVPHMGGAFVSIGNFRHSFMEIKQNIEPFVFPPFQGKTKKQANGSSVGAPEEQLAAHDTKDMSHDMAIEDAVEDESQDFDEANDIDVDFNVSEVLKDNMNGSIVDYAEAEADFEDLLDGEYHLEYESLNGSPSFEIEGSQHSPKYSPEIEDSGHIFSTESKWDHVKKGTKIIVQVVKEGLGTKGPTLTSYPKLRSRFWILSTRCNKIGVSKKITGVERTRLKVIAKTLQPQGFGLTVRTVAAGHSLEELQRDLEGLLLTWKNIVEHAKFAALAADEGVEGAIPVMLHRAMGQTLSVVQDYFNEKVKKMVVDSPRTYQEVTSYLQEMAPDLCDRVELFDKRIPLFDEFNIEEEISNMLSKQVPLPNGGSLVIEQTEALVSIDVNGGHGMFGHGASQEKATLDVNLAAAKQIAKELRLRDIGGIIVVDFIDMADDLSKRLVYEEVKKAVERDRSLVNVSELSRHGLMEITRKRVRPSVTFMISEPCTCCHATGRVEALETSFSKIEQKICRLLATMNQKADPEHPKSWPRFILRVDHQMCEYLTSGKRTRLAILSSSLRVWILLKVARGFTRGTFEVKPFTDEEKPHRVPISMLQAAEARTSNSQKKETLIPVKKPKTKRK
ncbi:hypothetical protein SLA2020_245660 [Shorea laevis]